MYCVCMRHVAARYVWESTMKTSESGPYPPSSSIPHASILYEEIMSQPELVEQVVVGDVGIIAAARDRLLSPCVSHVIIVARGTSDNAARYAQYAWGSLLGLPVTLAAPSLVTRYGAPLNFEGAVVVGISQSGRSPDLLSVVSRAAHQRRPTVAFTNDMDSPLARMVDVAAQWLGGLLVLAGVWTALRRGESNHMEKGDA